MTKVILSTLIGAILSGFFVLLFNHIQGYFGFWDYVVVVIVAAAFAVAITMGIDVVVCAFKDERIKVTINKSKTWNDN